MLQSTALMLACNYGQTAVVRYLLQAGADMTLKGDDGMTCLHLATQNGHLECAQAILDQKNTPRKFLNSQVIKILCQKATTFSKYR